MTKMPGMQRLQESLLSSGEDFCLYALVHQNNERCSIIDSALAASYEEARRILFASEIEPDCYISGPFDFEEEMYASFR